MIDVMHSYAQVSSLLGFLILCLVLSMLFSGKELAGESRLVKAVSHPISIVIFATWWATAGLAVILDTYIHPLFLS